MRWDKRPHLTKHATCCCCLVSYTILSNRERTVTSQYHVRAVRGGGRMIFVARLFSFFRVWASLCVIVLLYGMSSLAATAVPALAFVPTTGVVSYGQRGPSQASSCLAHRSGNVAHLILDLLKHHWYIYSQVTSEVPYQHVSLS